MSPIKKLMSIPELSGDQPFTVTAASTDDNPTGVDAGGPHVRTIAGSGEIKLTDGTDDIVPRGSKPNLVFSYKAATKLADVTITINQPNVDGGWQNLTLQKTHARADNYVTISGGGNALLDLNGLE